MDSHRLEKLREIKKKNINPYPNFFNKKHSIQQIFKEAFEDTFQEIEVQTAGRVLGKRPMGKAGFLEIADQDSKIQVYFNQKQVSEESFFICDQLDIGDLIGIEGITFKTKTNQPSIKIKSCVLLAKNLSIIPIVKETNEQVFDQFSDIETRYRKRYLDLCVNVSVRKDFMRRSEIIFHLRNFLINKNFLEVETPMMQSIASGAAAKPFKTFHNTLNMPLYLRVAPELFLKRLLVGGFEKVFELNRNFRNEGISTKHNPEFTMIEIYQAYANYETMMNLVEEIFTYLASKIFNSLDIPYQDKVISLKAPWQRLSYLDSIKKYTQLDFEKFILETEPDFEEAKKMSSHLQISVNDVHTFWELLDKIFSAYVEPKLIQPIFITDFPKAMSPLAKSSNKNPHLAERFEPYILGWEVGNAFSELNDPQEQEIRFKEQLKMKEAGAEEIVELDSDYIEALKVGMPPSGGLGIGIDRLVMLFNNKESIKDVILFPLLKLQL